MGKTVPLENPGADTADLKAAFRALGGVASDELVGGAAAIASGNALDVRAVGALSTSNDNSSLFATALAQSPTGRIFFPKGRWPGDITITADGQGVLGAGKPRFNGTNLVDGAVLLGAVVCDGFKGVEFGRFGLDQTALANTVIDGFRGGGGSAATPIDLDAYWHDLVVLGRGYAVGGSAHAFLIQGGRNAKLRRLHAYRSGHGLAYRASGGDISGLYTEDTEISTLTFKGAALSGLAQDCQNCHADKIIGRTTGTYAPRIVVESYDGRTVSDITVSNVVLNGGSSGPAVLATSADAGVTKGIKFVNLISNNNGNADRAVGCISASDVAFIGCTVTNATGTSFKATNSPTTKLIGCTSVNPGAGHLSGTVAQAEVNGAFSGSEFSDSFSATPGAVKASAVGAEAYLTFYRNGGGAGTAWFAQQWRTFNNQGLQLINSPSANARGAENFTRSSIYINAQGRVGFGGTPSTPTDPTAAVHLPAGTAASNTAPLKLTTASAALNTTPEAGAIETDGTDLYWTNSAGVRKKVTVA